MKTASGKNESHHAKNGTVGSDRFADLAVFVEVARHASFAEASRRTRTPTSTVSRAVRRLEEALGTRLLQRTSRTVALTDEGRQLLLRSAPLVDDLADALRGVADRPSAPRGLVRVTAPAFTGATRVAAALASLASKYPGISVELDASNALRDLVEDRFDLALRVGPLADTDLVARRLWEASSSLYAHRELARRLLRGRRQLSLSQVERAPAVITRQSAKWRFRTADGRAVDVTPLARFTVNDPRAAVVVARRGVGIAVLPDDAVAGAEHDLIRVKTDFGEPRPAEIYAVYPSRRLLPVRVKLALEWLAAPSSAP